MERRPVTQRVPDDFVLRFTAGQPDKFFIRVENESFAVGENVPGIGGLDQRVIETLFFRRRNSGVLGEHARFAV